MADHPAIEDAVEQCAAFISGQLTELRQNIGQSAEPVLGEILLLNLCFVSISDERFLNPDGTIDKERIAQITLATIENKLLGFDDYGKVRELN